MYIRFLKELIMLKPITSTFLFFFFIGLASTLSAQKKGADNVAYQWGKLALEATANDTETFKPRPTVTSRYLGLIFTAVFDAWTRYDEKALPVYLTNVERRKKQEWTESNKDKAIVKTLAEQYAEVTAQPVMDERRDL